MLYLVKLICYSVILSSVELEFSACISITQEENNIIASKPMKLVCDIGTTITTAVTVRSPDDTIVVSCTPTIPFPQADAKCTSSGVYAGSINETTNTVIVTTNNLPGDVNGTWSCTHESSVATILFPNPIPCLVSESFVLSPSTLAANVTSDTTAFSLSATYSCFNVDVLFKWILKAGTSHEFASGSVSKDSSSCTSGTCIEVNVYTQTISSDSLFQFAQTQNLIGGFELSAEAHYSGGIIALQSHSIGYFEFRTETTTVETFTSTTTSQTPSVSTLDLERTERNGEEKTVSSTSLYETSEGTVSTQTLSVTRGVNINVDHVYLIVIIVMSSVCGLIVILAIIITILYHCGRLPISNKCGKHIKTEEPGRHSENSDNVKHNRITERTRKFDRYVWKENSGEKTENYDRYQNEQKGWRRIKDQHGKSETESFQFYAGRKHRNHDYLEMSETANTQRNTGITDMPRSSGFARKVTVPVISQMNVNDSNGYPKYPDSKILDFQYYDNNYSRRNKQNEFVLCDDRFDNRKTHANYPYEQYRLATVYPYYHNDQDK